MNINEITSLKDLGAYLKSKREEKGITLDYIEKETKIRERYLKAIEEGNFDLIPGGDVYIKGFLKNYSKTCGIDDKEVIEIYKSFLQDKEVENKDSTLKVTTEKFEKEQPQKKGTRKRRLKKRFIWGIAVIGIVIIVYFISLNPICSNKSLNTSNDASNPEQIVQTQIQNQSQQQNSVENSSVVKEVKSKINILEETEKRIIVNVDSEKIETNFKVFSDRCWISVKKDGKSEYEGILKQHEEKYLEANKELEIRIGNPKVVEIDILGEKLDLKGTNPITIIIKKQG
ncbi:MAG: helix-turn-helix domain-containing protein [Thermovenabulum sp.]|uniref:helix-turn-helix domain-containing protein n=1 Tax=Thermovenabulum sp. TaxID=3100335 RepID=UPI003C7D6EB8